MSTKLKRVIDLTSSLTEEKIVEAIRKARFGEKYEKLHCPYCGSSRVVRKGRMRNRPYLQRYYCKNCGKWFNDLTGTIFSRRKISIRDVLLMAYLLLKLGMSIMAISRELGVCYKTAYYTAKRILQQAEFFRSMFKALPPVEIDEVYQNAGTKGLKKRGQGEEG